MLLFEPLRRLVLLVWWPLRDSRRWTDHWVVETCWIVPKEKLEAFERLLVYFMGNLKDYGRRDLNGCMQSVRNSAPKKLWASSTVCAGLLQEGTT